MGVVCHIASATVCDRFGLAVWLARPARVTATIAGVPLTLNDRTWSSVAPSGGRRLYVYAGLLRSTRLTSRRLLTSIDQATWPVRIRIDFGDHNVVVTHVRLYLHAGWG